MSKKIIAHDIGKKWRSKDIEHQENVDFSGLLLSEPVLKGLEKSGFKKPSPIQVEAIPMGKFGRDLVIQAKSGTGKTLVFVIIALERMNHALFRPQVLIIVPTREIATQVRTVVKAVSRKFKNLSCNCFIGGLPISEDHTKGLTTQIAVGTPGRLKQLIQMRSLPTNSIKLLIFDEADELLSAKCFKEDMEDIWKFLPDEKQVLLTSATFNHRMKKILGRFLCNPFLVQLNRKQIALLGMVHYYMAVDYCPLPIIQYKIKLAALEKILKSVNFVQCLLFVNGIQDVEALYKDVRRMGFSASFMSSAKEQLDRLKAIEKLKQFKCKVLVSSNLTARGIDAENVDLVINFDIAYSTEIYMHRVGRAGRYGTIGAAISIIDDDKELIQLQNLQRHGNFRALKLPNPIPNDLIAKAPQFAAKCIVSESDNEGKNRGGKKKRSEKKQSEKKQSEKKQSDYVYDTIRDSVSDENTDDENYELKDVNETVVDTGDNACENVLSEPVTHSENLLNKINEMKLSLNSCQSSDLSCDSDFCEKEDLKDKKIHLSFDCDLYEKDDIKGNKIDLSCNNELCDKSSDLYEKDDIKGNTFKNDSEIIKEIYEAFNLEKNETDDRKLNDLHIDNASEVKNEENSPVQCKQKNIIDRKFSEVCIDNASEVSIIENEENNLVQCEQDNIINGRKLNEVHIDNASEVKNIIENQESSPVQCKQENIIIRQKLSEICIDNASEVQNITENEENNPVQCEQKNINISDKLKNVMKPYIDTYESNNKEDSIFSEIKFDEGCLQNDDSGKKFVISDSIYRLQSHQPEFLTKIFKSYLEFKASEARKKEAKDKIEESNEDNTEFVHKNGTEENKESNEGNTEFVYKNETEENKESNEGNTEFVLKNETEGKKEGSNKDNTEFVHKNETGEKKEESNKDNTEFVHKNKREEEKEMINKYNTDLVVEELTAVQLEFEENSECREVSREEPPTKNALKSTSYLFGLNKDKIEQENQKIAATEMCNPVVQNIIDHPFKEPAEESEFEGSDSIQGYSLSSAVSPVSEIDSKSTSSGSDTEDDSDTDFSSDSDSSSESHSDSDDSNSEDSDASDSTTASSLADSTYHHNNFRTGRQNPSLITESERSSREFNPFSGCRFSQRCRCACCAAPVHCSIPIQNSTRCPRMISNHNFLPNGYQVDCNYLNIRQPHAVNCFGVPHHYQQAHSRCCRSQKSCSRSCKIEGGYEKCKHQTPQRSPRCCHTLNSRPFPILTPSNHRCHPNTPDYPCENKPLCEMWYGEFYRQWLFLQNATKGYFS